MLAYLAQNAAFCCFKQTTIDAVHACGNHSSDNSEMEEHAV